MRTFRCVSAILAALLASGRAHADVDVRVGTGSGCATASIQAAIDAASNVNGITNILIARNTTYHTNWLNITGKNVRLIGGYQNCTQSVADDVRTVIDGSGGSQDSVIKVRGATSNVSFHNLDISGGDALGTTSGQHGGGVEIEDGPHALIYFQNTWIHNNAAREGGGLWIKNEHSTNANDVFVRLDHNTRIENNSALLVPVTNALGSGGGIWCSNARIVMTGGVSATVGSDIAGNHADDAGGGIRAENCKINIATTRSDAATIFNNTASGPGGGISVSGERALVALYTLNPLAPTLLSNNVAGGVGGAIDIGSSATVLAWDVILRNNISRSGGGAVSLFDNDASPDAAFAMRGDLTGAPNVSGSAEGVAVNCVLSLRCNRISFNSAVESGGTRRTGAAIRASTAGSDGIVYFRLYGTEVDDNTGENLVEMTGGLIFGSLDGTALFGNNVSAELLHNPNSAQELQVVLSTIAGNTIGGAATFRGAADFDATIFKNSIHWQPGKKIISVVSGTATTADFDFLLSNDLTGIPVSTHNLIADPLFVDPATQDFHLQLASPAIDYRTPIGTQTADHLPRLRDLASVANEFGAQDLGAYERQFDCAADTVFCNGFE